MGALLIESELITGRQNAASVSKLISNGGPFRANPKCDHNLLCTLHVKDRAKCSSNILASSFSINIFEERVFLISQILESRLDPTIEHFFGGLAS